MHSLRLVPIWLGVFLWGCSNQLPTPPPNPISDGGADLPSSQQPFTLQISPPTAQQVVSTGAPITVQFKAVQVITATGQQVDVTNITNWEVNPQAGQRLPLGVITRGTYTSGVAAGEGQVVAQYLGQTAMVPISLKLSLTDLSTANDQSNPPATSPAQFSGGQVVPAKAPTLLYPPSGAVLPENLGGLEVQWAAKAGTDLYQVEITGKWLDLLIYTTSTKGRLTLSGQEYTLLADAGLYGPVTVQVSGGNQSGVVTYGQSAAAQLVVTPQVTAGLYYFAARGSTQTAAQTPQGIYRYNWLSDPGTQAQPYATDKTTQLGRCAGCHSLSQDGRMLAYGTAAVWPPTSAALQPGGVIDVAASQVRLLGSNPSWVTSAITSAGNQVLVSANNQLSFVSTDVGSQVGTLPIGTAAGTTASQPSISADGQQVVFVRGTLSGGTNEVLNLQNGALMLLQAQAGVFSAAPTTLVPTQGTLNNYYPSFVPTTTADGQWILFTRAASGPSYDNVLADLWAMRSDGLVGPIRLANASAAILQNTQVGTSLTNSWPRVNGLPVQVNGRTRYYFTFSSRREYGVEITRTGTAKTGTGNNTVVLDSSGSTTTVAGWTDQIWLSTFDPALANQGQDPSSAAIWLPYQSPLSSNHTATWAPMFAGGNLF